MSNLFLFFGDDTYSLQEKLNFWRAEFCKKHGGDMNLEVLDGEQITKNKIETIVSAAPFLSEKRLVIIYDYLEKGDNDDCKETAAALDDLADFCVLVFVEHTEPDKRSSLFKKIQKRGTLCEFPLLIGSKLLAWINNKAKTLGVEIEEKAAIMLTELIGGDLVRMNNEMTKLGNYAPGRKITEKDIELLVDTTLTTSIFKLTDALGAKNIKTCARILQQLIDSGEDLHRILFMIIRQFRIILQVKDFLTHGTKKDVMVTKLKMHPFIISMAMHQCNNFSFPQLQQIYEALLKLDTQLKTGGIRVLVNDNREFTLALDRLVMNVCAATLTRD